MARKKSARNDEGPSGDVDMSPMIDCCFLLLIFFVVNATQLTVSKDPSVSMPSAISSTDLKDANGCIVVNVFNDPDKMEAKARSKYLETYNGQMDVIWSTASDGGGGKNTGYTQGQTNDLTEYIKTQKEFYKSKNMEEKSIRLYLRGDKDTPWERSATAIRCAAAAGVNNIVFGTLPAK